MLLLDNFLMWGGFFMVVPLIAVHYVDGLGWAAGTIGLVLAVRQVTQQGLAFVGGVLADRLGAKGPICAGMLVRGAGFLLMARADSFGVLLGAATLAAVGGALFEAPKAAAIAALTDPASRGRYYALLGISGGLGLTVGPLVGALLLRVDFAAVALVSGALYYVIAAVTWVGLPPVRVAAERGGQGLTGGLRLAVRDRPFLAFTALTMGYWFMWVQLTISLPLIAADRAGTADAVSWLYALNAGMTILLQYPLLRLAERRLAPLPTLVLGVATMALALALVPASGGTAGLLACVAGFSVGALLASPTQQTVAAGLANPAALGSYFGVGSLSLALGGGLGNYLGGLLYGLGDQLGIPALPWLVFAAVGAVAAIGLVALWRRLPDTGRADRTAFASVGARRPEGARPASS